MSKLNTFSPARSRALIKKMQSLRLLVVGDVMLDEFIWGKVTRISPEAPVPVVHVHEESAYPGGAANVARNLADFGVAVTACGLIGRDAGGKRLTALLEKSRIKTSGLVVHPTNPTSVKTRVIARQQHIVRVDREEKTRLDAKSFAKLAAFLQREIPKADAIVIEDYGKGLVTQELVNLIVALARKHKKLLTVDPNPSNPLDWSGVTAVKPNRPEAYATAGIAFDENEKSLQEVARILQERWKVPYLLITLGEQGMILMEKNKAPYHTPTRAREVFDVSGAGDTSISFFTLALAGGLSGVEASEIANHAAGIVVGKLGTATLNPDELYKSLSGNL